MQVKVKVRQNISSEVMKVKNNVSKVINVFLHVFQTHFFLFVN